MFSELNLSYWGYAIGAATATYATVRFVALHHLSEEVRDDIRLWLWGDYEDSWGAKFCAIFDGWYGKRHFTWNCFKRSSLTSLFWVFLLYLLFGPVLGLLKVNGRLSGDLNASEIFLFALALNLIPDYLSLLQTRYVLSWLTKSRRLSFHVLLLLLDFAATALIAIGSIYALEAVIGKRLTNPIELFALFSVYSIFFYSTFATSVLSWLFFLSRWAIKLLTSLGISSKLAVNTKPEAQLALMFSIFVLLFLVIFYPALKHNKDSELSKLDEFLCKSIPGYAAKHCARLTKDELVAIEYLAESCKAKPGTECIAAGVLKIYHDNNAGVPLLQRACLSSVSETCVMAATVTESANFGKQPDYKLAENLLEHGCAQGEASSCQLLGKYYSLGNGKYPYDKEKAAKYFNQACNFGDNDSCGYLGSNIISRTKDIARGMQLLEKACDEGSTMSCINIATNSLVGPKELWNPKRAKQLLEESCKSNSTACLELGRLYLIGLGVPVNAKASFPYFSAACDDGLAEGCANLGDLYAAGHVGSVDHAKAFELYDKSCHSHSIYAPACAYVANLLVVGKGVPKNDSEAYRHYELACNAGYLEACSSAQSLLLELSRMPSDRKPHELK